MKKPTKKEKFERIVKFGMPYDKRSDNPKKNYGISSMRIWLILKGKKGAVQVLFSTQLFLPSTINEYLKKGKNLFENYQGKDVKVFDCWDVGVHSKKKPSYMDKSDKQKCNIMGKCYYDGSSLRGNKDNLPEKFLEKGEEAIWEYLEKEYKEVFENDK